MSTYTVNAPLLHNGADYLPGDTVELDDNYAQVLIALGVVAQPAKNPARKKKGEEE